MVVCHSIRRYNFSELLEGPEEEREEDEDEEEGDESEEGKVRQVTKEFSGTSKL